MYVGLFVLGVTSSTAAAQEGVDPCSPKRSDFGSCLEAVESKGRDVKVAKALNSGEGAATEKIRLAEERVAAATRALQDLSTRTAKLRKVEETLVTAEARQRSASDEAIRAYEQLVVDELREEAKVLSQSLAVVRSGALRYAAIALEAPLPAMRRADVRPSPPTECGKAIEAPSVSLDVSDCAQTAERRAAQVIPGGELRVPGSVLNPPGFTALLSGQEAGGSVDLTLTTHWRTRSAPLSEKMIAGDLRVQRAAHLGASIGLKAGDGTIFRRDTQIDNADQFDNRAALKASLFANFFSPESRSSWFGRAKALSTAAVAACLADQQKQKSNFASSCRGQSLTDWVYAIGKDGKYLNAKIAEQANALYFRGAASVPRWGGGVNVEIGRSSYEYTTPALFAASFAGDFNDEGFKAAAFERSSAWVGSLSPYAYVRLTDSDSKFGLSLIPSYTVAKTLSYPNGYEKPLFCPAIATDAPFSTAGCRRFYGRPPTAAEVETWALEARSAFNVWGGIGLVAAPKVSWNDKDKTTSHPWLVSVPVLAFTDTAKTSAVGLKADWAFGQVDADGVSEDDDFVVKLIYQKSFNLIGK